MDDELGRDLDKDLKEVKRTLNRLNDRLFKYIFASRQHKENLIRFLNDVLNDPDRVVVDIGYIDREIDPLFLKGKGARFDVRAKTDAGRIFHVEVQIGEEKDFLDRCLFYTCMDYTSQLTIGEPYGVLGEVVFIAVTNFDIFPDKPDTFHSVQKLLDVENHKCYCGGIELHFLEIPKLRKQAKGKAPDKLTGLERMMAYMGTVGESSTLIEIAKYDSDIEKILYLEEMFLRTPETWVSYMLKEREETDWDNYVKSRVSDAVTEGFTEGFTEGEAKGKAEGFTKGEAKGEAKGKAKGKAETAINLLRMGMDKEKVSQATGLSLEEIQNLTHR
jgi:predicted transposase/invertase (TIGR01784 family)